MCLELNPRSTRADPGLRQRGNEDNKRKVVAMSEPTALTAEAAHAAEAATTTLDAPDCLVPMVSYTAPIPSRANVDPAGQNS